MKSSVKAALAAAVLVGTSAVVIALASGRKETPNHRVGSRVLPEETAGEVASSPVPGSRRAPPAQKPPAGKDAKAEESRTADAEEAPRPPDSPARERGSL